MDKIINSEVIESTKEVLKSRSSSPVYGSFIIVWIIFHWNFVFTMFFVNEDNILKTTGLLKNEYLYLLVNHYTVWSNFILPSLFTYLAIWIFPRFILIKAFEKSEDHKYDKIIYRIQKEDQVNRNYINKLDTTVQVAQKEQEIKNIDPTALWFEEYKQFTKTNLFKGFDALVDIVYNKQGYLSTSSYKIPTDILIFADTHNLIEYISTNKIEFNEKGKFFVKKYQENQIK